MFKAIIFDMDGVLVDSHPYIWYSFQKVLKEQGITFSEKDIKKYIGLSLHDQLDIWKKEHGINTYSVHEFSEKSGKIQLEHIKKEHKHDAHLHKFIKHAKEQKMKLAVATNSSRDRAEKMLKLLKIEHYFDVLVTADDVVNYKPHPEMFLKAAAQLGVKPEECIVFEDALSGIRSAKQANMKAVALVTEFHTKKDKYVYKEEEFGS